MFIAIFRQDHLSSTPDSFPGYTTQEFETQEHFDLLVEEVKTWKGYQWATLLDSETGKVVKTNEINR